MSRTVRVLFEFKGANDNELSCDGKNFCAARNSSFPHFLISESPPTKYCCFFSPLFSSAEGEELEELTDHGDGWRYAISNY